MTASHVSSSGVLNPRICGVPAAPSGGRDVSARQVQHTLCAGVLDALGVENAGHGVRGIAAALRDVLANADPDAPDPVPALLETINSGLEAAAKKLSDQGIDQKTIDAAIGRFRSALSRELDALAPAAPVQQASSTSAAAVHAVTKEKFSLSILTAEGDRVSIRFRATNVTDAAAVVKTNGAGTTIASDAHVISRGRLKIEVQGDLNDDELAAIGDLLDKVDGIARDFFGGDVQAAFDAAGRVGFDSQEISAFNLRLSYSQRIGFASTYAQAATPVAAPTATPAEPAAPAKPAASSSAAAPAVAGDAKIKSAKVPAELTPVDHSPTADEAAQTATTAPTPGGSAQATIATFAKSVLAKLAAVPDAGNLQFALRWKVDFLMSAIAAVGPADGSSTAASKALGGALGAESPVS